MASLENIKQKKNLTKGILTKGLIQEIILLIAIFDGILTKSSMYIFYIKTIFKE